MSDFEFFSDYEELSDVPGTFDNEIEFSSFDDVVEFNITEQQLFQKVPSVLYQYKTKDFCAIDIDDSDIDNNNNLLNVITKNYCDHSEETVCRFNIFQICESCATKNEFPPLKDITANPFICPILRSTQIMNDTTPHISSDLATPRRTTLINHLDYLPDNNTPHIQNFSTPTPSAHPRILELDTPSDLNSDTESIDSDFTSQSPELSTMENETGESESELGPDSENAMDILKKIRIKNINRIIIATLNINSLASKFEQLREVIGNNIDILKEQPH